MKKDIAIEYGNTWIEVSVPEKAMIVQYGTPPFPRIQPHPNPEQAVRNALENPVGLEPIADLVKRGGKVTVAFDDPIKRPEPIRIIIPIVVEELRRAGVREEDITLLSANGAHCKWQPSELKPLLGAQLYNRFRPFDWRDGSILNHDCTQGNVHLGETNLGDEVEYDKAVVEADQLIYVGTVFPVPFGGYSGQGVAIGLASIRALTSLHSYEVYRTPQSLHSDYRPEKNTYRKHKLAVHEKIEAATGKKIFYVDAITGPAQKIVNVFAGHVPELETIEYPEADTYFNVEVPQMDIIVVGLPHTLDYDTSDNPACACNFAARPARAWRNKPILNKNGVMIVVGKCSGAISPRRPADPEAFKLYRNCFDVKELYAYTEAFCNNPDYLYKYHHEYAYSPIHSVFMMANMETLQRIASHTIFVGEVNPGVIREAGFTPVRSFDEALETATEIVGGDANILVLPSYHRDPKPIFDVI